MSPGPRWPLVARGVLLLGALAAGAVALVGLRSLEPAPTTSYSCPMHPDVRRSAPGDCPLCGMALVSRSPDPPAHEASGAPELPAGSVQVVTRRILTERRSVPAYVDAAGQVQALVPEEEVPHLGTGEPADFRPGGGARSLPVRRTASSAVPHDAETWRAGFEVARPGARLVPGTVGWLALGERPRPSLLVPSSAVLHSPEGPAVLVAVRGGTVVERRPVRLGQAPEGLAVLLSGVEENERVVVRGAFFLDAERRLGAGEGR